MEAINKHNQRISRRYRRIALVLIPALLLSFGLAGCKTMAPTATTPIAPAAPASYLPPVQPRAAGSLWSPDRHIRLYDDLRARQVGDIVTVQIVENTSASKEANTSSDRESTIDTGISALFGVQSFARNGFDASKMFGANTTNEFEGKGSTDRKSSMTASVACRVVQVLPAGNLYIKGSRLTVVNQEQQYITLEGVIRPTDITPNNVVLSTNVAEARISYTGSGPVSDQQRPGWFTRLMNFLWPF